ncbi:mitochondrial 37S ribosomal uS4m domain-containing protein [Aspergillus mulundensis]|uniref:Small ribosomal subunit protein uS4m n=1 Tax=Aspergillus mulundensis TaxID=1810919 RepID=A0A3D8R542_9EURO|nr:hypothetical protein DSM5745_08857 [Aspergillus mulundensis]RDW69097.1 hypothetical protein DSM5745_08857 [Aspergillus mulundensis]
MRNRATTKLSRPKIRQSWSKYNLYNLNRTRNPSTQGRTFFQQKWTAKAMARAYHGEQVRESQWTRMFSRRMRSVVPMNPWKMAQDDGSGSAAGRGSGLEPIEPPTVYDSTRTKVPYTNMAFAPLERRLDVAIFRALFASSARQARQFVLHGAVTVNGKKMRFPGYLLNPGDMFQVDPERVMFATGAPKDKFERREGRVERKKAAEAAKAEEAKEEGEGEEAKEKEEAETKDAKDDKFDPRGTLKRLLSRAKNIMADGKDVLPAKRKQDLRGFQKAVRRVMSKNSDAASSMTDNLETQFSELLKLLKATKIQSKEVKEDKGTAKSAEASAEASGEDAKPTEALTQAFRRAAENPEADVDTSELTEEELDVLKRALVQMRDNPIDHTKPYATPWRPRPYMSAFAFIPRYLEVNQNICAAVYLRHPVARPGLSEVPTPFGEVVSTAYIYTTLRPQRDPESPYPAPSRQRPQSLTQDPSGNLNIGDSEMYNPWSTHAQAPHTHPHHHGHHGPPHAQPHPHHSQHAHHHAPTVTSVGTVSVPGTVSPGTRLVDLDSSPSASPSASSFRMNWLPSMLNGRVHSTASSLPTISSNLRMQHTHPQTTQQQAPVSMIVDSRAQSGGAVVGGPGGVANQAQVQQQVVSVESEESDRSESPGGTPGARDVSGADALGEPEFGSSEGGQNGRGEDIDVEVLGEDGSDANGKGVGMSIGENGEITHNLPGGLNFTSRKHGKRLTTKEEVSLFEICNRHAAEFGQRSNLCKWWMTVTMEFTRGQKHPYSWHSVRRKVELVTKQRMKFLEEQREKGATGTETTEDLSNLRWRTVVDAWIPTWQRWEEAEARRIEKRDSRRPRKRKWTATTPTSSGITAGDGWDLPSSSAPGSGDAWRAPSSTSSSPMVNHTSAAPSSTPVRLPPGFDTLFSQSSTQTPPVSTFNPHTQPHRTPQTNNHAHIQSLNPSTPNTSTNPAPQQTPDSAVMVAMLETLGKLNKHLESNSSSSQPQNSTNANSNANADSEPSSAQPQPSSQDSNDGGLEEGQTVSPEVLRKLKEELKSEMMSELRAEWDKERAVLDEKLDSVQRTQEMILELLRQEPS